MTDENLNFEDFEKELNAFDFTPYEMGGKGLEELAAAREDPGKVIEKICNVYKVIRPILKGIAKIPFIPRVIKRGIGALCNVLDLLCP